MTLDFSNTDSNHLIKIILRLTFFCVAKSKKKKVY